VLTGGERVARWNKIGHTFAVSVGIPVAYMLGCRPDELKFLPLLALVLGVELLIVAIYFVSERLRR
jgi:hypothetical protein